MTVHEPRNLDELDRQIELLRRQEATARRSGDRALKLAIRKQRRQLRDERQLLNQANLASKVIDEVPSEATPPSEPEPASPDRPTKKSLGLGLLKGMFPKKPSVQGTSSPPSPKAVAVEDDSPKPATAQPPEVEPPPEGTSPALQDEPERVEPAHIESHNELAVPKPSPDGPAWVRCYDRLPEEAAKALQSYFLETYDSSRFESLLHHLLMTQLNHLWATAVGVGLGDQAEPFLEELHKEESSTDRRFHFPVEQVEGLSRLLRDAELGELCRPREVSSDAARILLVRASLFRTLVLAETMSDAIPAKIDRLWQDCNGDIQAFVRKAIDRARMENIPQNKGDFHYRQLPARLRELRNALTHAHGPDWLRGLPLPVVAFRKACNPYIGPALLEWIEREGWLMDLAVGNHLADVDNGWLFQLDRPGSPPFFVARYDDQIDLEERCLIDLATRRALFTYSEI